MLLHLVVHVLLPHGGLQGVQQRVHQPLALPQPAPGLGTVGAHVPEKHGWEIRPAFQQVTQTLLAAEEMKATYSELILSDGEFVR